MTNAGCDSTVTTNISVVLTIEETVNVDLCPGEMYEGVVYTSDVTLVDNYVSSGGCDSIVTTVIVVEDIIDPVLSGLPGGDITIECDGIPSAPIVTATDNCSTGLTVDYNETIGTGCPYTITRTWEVTDDEGNSTTFVQNITVEDTTDPVLVGVPGDVTVECDAIPSAPVVTATDNCSTGLVVSYNETIGTGCPYVITRTWETTDDCGNTISATQNITVEDTTIPVLNDIPDDVVLECADCFQSFANGDFEEHPSIGGWAYLDASDVPGWNTTGSTAKIEIQRSGSVDGVASYSGEFHAELNSNAVGDFYQEFCTIPTTTLQISFAHHKRMNGSNTTDDIMGVYGGPDLNNLTLLGTFTATSTSGWTVHTVSFPVPANQATSIFLFRAIQAAPSNNTLGNLIDDINVVTLFETTLPTAQDNCDSDVEISVSTEVVNGACSNQMQLVRTWTAVDDCGNIARDSQRVSIGDFDAPVFNNVPSDATVECDNVPNAPIVTATDNCSSDLTVNFNETVGVGCPYTIIRTWEVTDDCDNTATATQTITVEDTTDPVLVGVPGNTTVECGNVPAPPIVTAIDNCSSGLTVNFNETIGTGCPFAIIRTWDVTDDCGNSTTASQTIIVEDTTDPVLIGVPGNTTVECGAVPNAPTVTATDNCATGLVVNYNETIGTGCPYTITRIWEVTDECGNTTSATQTITVEDTTDPVLVGVPADITVECNSIPSAPLVTATDNCSSGLTVNFNETSGSGCFYTIIRSWEVTDDCGNTATATQTITVQDTTDPVLVGVPLDITVDCNSIPSASTVTANDNCSSILMVNYNETIGAGCPYNITRSWSVTDDCGNNLTAIQTITVEDTTNPVLGSIPADITVECDDIPSPANPIASDDCDTDVTISLSEVVTQGNCTDSYILTRTWTAMDNCGNTDAKSQIITVEDNTAPILNGVPANVTVECDNVPPAPTVTVTDNCATGLVVDYSEILGSGCQYEITRTWTVTDDCGNTTVETQIITVEDTVDPVLVDVPGDVTVECDAIPSIPLVSATDNCSTGLNVNVNETIGTGCPYVITRIWEVVDDCGNTAVESQVITVTDSGAPVLSAMPVDLTVNCDNIPTPDVLTATDDCDNNVNVSFSSISSPGICLNQYSIERTWTATDACGNSTSHTQNINVLDCGPDVQVMVSPDYAVCEGANISLSASLSSGYPTPYFQWQFSDDNGANWINLIGANSSTNSFTAFLHKAGLYRLVVANSSAYINNPDCNQISDPVEIIVYPDSPVTTLIEEICDGDSFMVGTDVYTTSGNYSNLLTNVNGCDSVVNLSLTVHPNFSEDITEIICEGESVQIGNSVYTTSGNYTDTLNTVNGCDSVVNLNLTVNPIYSIDTVKVICEGESVQVGNSIYTASGNYTDILSTIHNCDSIVNLNLIVNPIYTEDISQTICEGESAQVGNNIYTTSGNYTDVLTSVSGCDSIVNLSLTVFEIQEDSIEIVLCEGDIYDGFVYTSDSILIDTFSAITGCDSIFTTNIIVNPVYSELENIQLCEGYEFEGTTYFTDTLLIENLQTVNGCDSIISTQINITETIETYLDVNLCYNEEYEGVNYTESTVLVNTYPSEENCDSLVTTNIFVHEEVTYTYADYICEGEEYVLGDSTYSESGVYSAILTSEFGCDSTVTIELTVVEIYSTTINASICEGESYVINGIAQTTAGTYYDTLNNNTGCPTILITNLTVNQPYESTVYESICQGESYFAEGEFQTTAGTYIDTYTAINNCDSVIITELTVLPVSENTMDVSICDGESYFAGGANQTNSGVYSDTYTGANGCDSVIVTNLLVLDNQEVDVAYPMCEGDSILVDGVYYTEPGSYYEIFGNSNGCDSTVNYIVEIIDRSETYIEEVICEGDSIFLAGEFQIDEGEYIDQFTAHSGCDSLVITMLFVEQSIELIAEDQDICFGDEVQLTVEGSSSVQWFPETGLSCVDCVDPIATPTETTTYIVTAEDCLGTTSQTEVTVTVNHPPSLTLSNNASIVQNEEITLSAVSSDPNALITWYVNDEIVCEDCTELTAEPTVSLVYQVTVENDFGCINSDEIYLEIEDGCSYSNFEVPNIISPNGDGANDFFKIKYEGVSDVSLLRIYNRWGELIFETRNIETLWDGTFKGEKLNPGVYIYYFEGHCLDNKPFTRTGNITLLK